MTTRSLWTTAALKCVRVVFHPIQSHDDGQWWSVDVNHLHHLLDSNAVMPHMYVCGYHCIACNMQHWLLCVYPYSSTTQHMCAPYYPSPRTSGLPLMFAFHVYHSRLSLMFIIFFGHSCLLSMFIQSCIMSWLLPTSSTSSTSSSSSFSSSSSSSSFSSSSSSSSSSSKHSVYQSSTIYLCLIINPHPSSIHVSPQGCDLSWFTGDDQMA